MEKRIFIYVLRDPDTNAVKWVGSTVNPAMRLSQHLALSGSPGENIKRWIISLRNNNKQPILVVVEETYESQRLAREEYWWKYYEKLDNSLLNQKLIFNPQKNGFPSVIRIPPILYSRMQKCLNSLYRDPTIQQVNDSLYNCLDMGITEWEDKICQSFPDFELKTDN